MGPSTEDAEYAKLKSPGDAPQHMQTNGAQPQRPRDEKTFWAPPTGDTDYAKLKSIGMKGHGAKDATIRGR